jgi:hypothetical protein
MTALVGSALPRRSNMSDVTVKEIDEMDAIGGGIARRARAELGVTAWGMQVLTLPPSWDGYPDHEHGPDAYDPNQEEVYIPLEGTMPPEPLRIVGASAIGSFFRTVPAEGALERIRLVPTRANGQPALAAYLERDDGAFGAYGVMVLSLDGGALASITGFAGDVELFPQLGLPTTLPR